MSKSKELNTLRLLDVLKKGKLPAKFHLFGLGEAYTTANTSKNRHVVNVGECVYPTLCINSEVRFYVDRFNQSENH